MSALTIAAARPALDLAALRADLAAVLTAHGLDDADFLRINVTPLVQEGADAGVSFDGMAWYRPTAQEADLLATAGGAA